MWEVVWDEFDKVLDVLDAFLVVLDGRLIILLECLYAYQKIVEILDYVGLHPGRQGRDLLLVETDGGGQLETFLIKLPEDLLIHDRSRLQMDRILSLLFLQNVIHPLEHPKLCCSANSIKNPYLSKLGEFSISWNPLKPSTCGLKSSAFSWNFSMSLKSGLSTSWFR